MFKTVRDLLKQCETRGLKIWEIMLEQEMAVSGRKKDRVWASMKKRYDVMDRAVQTGIQGVRSHSGLTGGDAVKLYHYLQSGRHLTDKTLLRAICYAVATNEVNASMGVVCATPTAGSSGTLPGVLLALRDEKGYTEAQIIQAMFTAGAIGYTIANNAFISGAAGGCQAEVGAAAAMAAAAAVELSGGSPDEAGEATAIALKNLLGLVCDPVAGLVEVPCVKRNAGGVAIALTAAEMALAGVGSRIPPDEVISAMHGVGLAMPENVRETARGGLAVTETGKAWARKMASEAKHSR